MTLTAKWAIPALILGAMGISFASPLAKLAATDGGVDWVASAFWRTALSVPILWAVMLATARSKRTTSKGHWAWLLLPGFFFAFDLLTWHLSFAWTTAASATLLANLSVIIVGIVGWRILRERLDGRYAIGAAMALSGVAWLVWATPEQGSFPLRMRGDVLAMTTALFYAAYILTIKMLRGRHSTLTLMAVATTTSAVILLPAMLMSGGHMTPTATEGWWWLILLAVIPHCLGQGLIVLSLAVLPASFAAVTLLLQPVATAVWGWLFLDEALLPSQMVAGGFVLIGIVLARLGSGR